MSRPYRPAWDRRPSEALKPTEKLASAVGGGRSPYALGRAFEVSIRDQLRRRGYFVLRAGASKGKIDLLAVGKDRPPLFIQAKRTGVIGSAEWNEVFEIATEHGGWPVLCMRGSPRTTLYYRIDAKREPRRPGRPWTLIDPTDCSELLPPEPLPL